MSKRISFRKIYDHVVPYSKRKPIKSEYKEIMGTSDKVFYDHKNVGYKYSPIEKNAIEELFRKQGFDQEIWEVVKD